LESRPLGGHRWLAKGGAVVGAASQLLRRAGANAVRVLSGRERAWSGLRALLLGFYAAVEGKGPSPVPIDEAVRVATLLDEIRHQLEETASSASSYARTRMMRATEGRSSTIANRR